MTQVPHPELQRMLEVFDDLVEASEAYLAFVAEGAAELESANAPEPALNTWRRQQRWVQGFIDFLDDDVLERLRELVDRTAVMETARKDDFV